MCLVEVCVWCVCVCVMCAGAMYIYITVKNVDHHLILKTFLNDDLPCQASKLRPTDKSLVLFTVSSKCLLNPAGSSVLPQGLGLVVLSSMLQAPGGSRG